MIESLSDETEWFLILHSDDLALPNFIARNVEIIRMCDSRVASVSSNYWVFDEKGERLSATERDVVLFREGTPENIRTTALVGCWWHISGALVNKRLWCEFGGRSPRFQCAGDWHLVLRWQAAGYTVGHSVIATTKYRLWLASSLSSSDYPICRDYTDRTAVALDLPNVFSGSTRAKFAGKIFYGAARRGLKFLILGRSKQAFNAFKVSFASLTKLLMS